MLFRSYVRTVLSRQIKQCWTVTRKLGETRRHGRAHPEQDQQTAVVDATRGQDPTAWPSLATSRTNRRVVDATRAIVAIQQQRIQHPPRGRSAVAGPQRGEARIRVTHEHQASAHRGLTDKRGQMCNAHIKVVATAAAVSPELFPLHRS